MNCTKCGAELTMSSHMCLPETQVNRCGYCNKVLDDFLIMAEQVSYPVLNGVGEDITNEFFVRLAQVRKVVKHYE